jgi:drug/metabolite transporter (DMT)-like permease
LTARERFAPLTRRLGGDRLGIILALLAVYIIWGSTYLAIAIAVESIPPFMMAGVRFLVAGSLLFVFLLLRGGAIPSWREWRNAAVIGVLLLTGGNGLVTFAEDAGVSSGLAALAVGTVPLWAAIFAGLWGRWPVRFEWVGLGLGFVGVLMLNLESDLRASPVGAAALMFATASWAFGSIWSRQLALPAGLMASAVQMLAGGAALMAISLGTAERMTAMPSEGSLWALAYLIVIGALVGYSAYLYLLKKVRPALATSYAYVNPVVAVGLGVGFYGESITAFGLGAMVAIIAGVALVVLSRGRSSSKASS